MSNIRDTLILDAKTVVNETITSSAIYLAFNVGGVPEMIFSDRDNVVTSAVKSGFVASAVNVGGAFLRNMFPMLNVL